MYVSIPFFMGLHHGKVYGLFFNNSYRSVFNFGASNRRFASFSFDGGALDQFFIFDASVGKILEHYTARSPGRMPLPPRWSLGYQQSRCSYYPEEPGDVHRQHVPRQADSARRHRPRCRLPARIPAVPHQSGALPGHAAPRRHPARHEHRADRLGQPRHRHRRQLRAIQERPQGERVPALRRRRAMGRGHRAQHQSFRRFLRSARAPLVDRQHEALPGPRDPRPLERHERAGDRRPGHAGQRGVRLRRAEDLGARSAELLRHADGARRVRVGRAIWRQPASLRAQPLGVRGHSALRRGLERRQPGEGRAHPARRAAHQPDGIVRRAVHGSRPRRLHRRRQQGPVPSLD